jgi:hypothetical protein
MEISMKRLIDFFRRLVATDRAKTAPTREPVDEPLREKIAKWRTQAREFESLGCHGLARDFRESATAHERQLALRQAGRKAA